MMEKILAFLNETGVFFFATVDGDKPRVRPFGFKMVYEGKLYFGMGKAKQSFKQLQANPQVEVCAAKGPKWIRIKGTANFTDDAAALDQAFKTLPMLEKLYPNKADFGLVYLEDLDVEIADMQGNFEKVF